MKNIKTLIVASLIILCPALVFAQTQTAYNPDRDPKYNLGQGSNVDFDLNFRMGTGGVHIYIGTETCNGVGTNGVVVGSSSAAPQIAVTYASGSTTFNMKNMHVKVDGSELMTTGSGVAAVSGSGSDTTLINPTFEGSGSADANFSLTANGENISDDEIAFLNNLYGNIQGQLDTKVGSTTARVGAIECGGTSTAGTAGSTTVKFQGGGDLTSVMTNDGGGHFTITTTLTGTASAKPDICEGTQSVVIGADKLHFGSSTFKVTPNGSGVDIETAYPGGTPVKVVVAGTNTASASTIGTIPFDDSPPLITEGTQILSINFAASNPNNWVFVEAVVNANLGGSDAAAFIAAIFQGGTSTAIGANYTRPGADASNNKDMVFPVTCIPFLAGTTTSQTFTLRCGVPSANGRVNSCSTDAVRKLGGVSYTIMKITEYAP